MSICLNVDSVSSFLKKWKTSNDFQRTTVKLVDIYQARQHGPLTKQMTYKYGKKLLLLVEQLRLAQGLSVDFQAIEELDRALVIHDKHEIVVNGRMLMEQLQLNPGPLLGKVLNRVEYEIVEGNLINDKEAIMAFVEDKLVDE